MSISYFQQIIGLFKTAGLSNTALKQNQNFGSHDRAVCPIPLYDPDSSSKNHEIFRSNSFRDISNKVRQLQRDVSILLNRTGILDERSEHEAYFSEYLSGSLLKRHLDERNEEGPNFSLFVSCFLAFSYFYVLLPS